MQIPIIKGYKTFENIRRKTFITEYRIIRN